MQPQEIRLKFKYRVDKNGVKSYGSKNNNSRPKTRSKLGGKKLEAAQAQTREHQRVKVIYADGRTLLKRRSEL